MLYVITEDSNSARAFWDIVAKTFKGSTNYKLVSFLLGKDGKEASGNTTLWNQVKAIVPKMSKGDDLLIAFDNIMTTNNFNTVTFLKNARQICSNAGINLKVTSYYCFEEIYLSYIEVLRCNQNNKECVIKAIEFVRKNLLNQVNYFDINNIDVVNFINYYKKDSSKNREHFANALLLEATKIIKGNFKITKSGSTFSNNGRCWLQNCKDIQSDIISSSGNKAFENICGENGCKFKCKNCTTKEKLLDLNSNSMLVKSSYDLTKI